MEHQATPEMEAKPDLAHKKDQAGLLTETRSSWHLHVWNLAKQLLLAYQHC